MKKSNSIIVGVSDENEVSKPTPKAVAALISNLGDQYTKKMFKEQIDKVGNVVRFLIASEDKNLILLQAKGKFNDYEFSDNDLKLLSDIKNKQY